MAKSGSVRDNKAEKRFEMDLDDGQTALIDYRERQDGTVELLHTKVPKEAEGKGIGSSLVEGTLQLVQNEDRKVVPTCQFVAAYIQRHPEYKFLLG